MNEYDDLIKSDKQEGLRSSLYVAAQQQPDTEATLQRLADRWGLPVDTVRAKRPEVELQDKLNSFDYEKAIKENPKLSAWLADPKNAGVAQDDFNRLSRMEKLMTHGKDYAGSLYQGVVGQGVGSTLSGLGELYGIASRRMGGALASALPQEAADVLNTEIPWWMSPEQILKRPGEVLKQSGKDLAPPPERQTLGTDVVQGIGQLGTQIAAFLLTGGASSTTMMLAQGADIMAEKTAKDKGNGLLAMEPGAARDTAIVAGGAITALTERYGLDKILNRVPPAIKNRVYRFIADKVAAGGIEAGQELTEGLLHDVSRRILTNQDAEVLQGVGREMTAAGLSAAIVRTALGVRGFRQAQQTEDFFKALGEDSKASKLRERLPERFKELVASYTEDGPVQNVFIPAERFRQYFQEAGIDPAQAAQEVGAKNFTEALATGGDVVISMADFATHVAPTDHLQGLMPDLRLRQDEMTIRESKLEEANRDEQDRRIQEEIDRINAAAGESASLDTAIQRIVTDVEGQLMARYDANTARQLATVMRGVAVLAQRANPGADPVQAAQDLWARYGLTINANPLPSILTQGRDFDATIDPLLDRLRTGDIPNQKAMFGESLTEFIARIGGIREGYGELKDANLNYGRGEAKLVRPNGRALDEIGALAVEAGYFQGDETGTVDETTLLNAISSELGGSPTYSIQQENAQEIGLMQQLEELDKFIGQLGVDLSKLDNAGVKALMVTQGVTYNQTVDQTQTEGFKKWSHGHDVVMLGDEHEFEDGVGVVVQALHGTTGEFDTFERSKANVESDLGAGFYATNNRNDVSENYAGLGPDLTNKVERLAERIASETDREYNDPDVIAEAKQQYMANQGATMPLFIRFDNPVVLGGSYPTELDFNDGYDPETEEYGEESGKVVELMEALREIESEGEFSDFDAGKAIEAMLSDNFEGDNITAENLIANLKGSEGIMYAMDENGDMAGNEIIRQAFSRIGYDGFIDQTVDQKFGSQRNTGQSMAGMDETTVHFVAFEPTQLKSSIGNTGEFSETNPSILRQGNEGDNRGFIKISDSGKMQINLLEKANLSTFLHETGHFYLEVMGDLANPKEAPIEKYKREAAEIELALPAVAEGFTRLYRGNREGEIGKNPQFTNSLAGIALPFADAYGGALSYVDVPTSELNSYVNKGAAADNAEFVLPAELAAQAKEVERQDNRTQIQKDYAKILQFLGVSDRSEISVEHHEKFARANEMYLLEGKAPAPELQGVFQRFRAWLKLIYRQMTALNVELTDEVRGVFDRIYATDAEIERASQEANIPFLLTTAAEAGMTDAEFEAYKGTIEATTAEAKEELQTKLMRIEKLKREAWWREERKKVAEEVAAEYDALPAALAMVQLTETGGKTRLNRAQLVERYGEAVLKRLPRGYGEGKGAVYSDEGIDIDTAAELMGFGSADEMIEALANLPNRKRFIAAEADRRMSERHGDLLNDVAMADEAMMALHNEKREQVLRIELRALAKRIKDVAPVVKAERQRQAAERRAAVEVARTPAPAQLRQIAAGLIGQKQVRDLNPYGYLVAERRAANKSFEAMAKGDLQTAYNEKQRELLNHYLYREAMKAKQEAEATVKYLKGFEAAKKRQELGKAGADYLEQIDAMLERYEFKQISNIRLVKRESLRSWLEQQEAEGNAVAVPESVIDETKRVNWRTVQMDELRALRDSVKNIAHLASLKNKLLKKGKQIEFAKVVGDLLNAINNSKLTSTGELGLPSRRELGVKGKAAAAWRKFDASHIKVEQLVEWLDGGDINGPWAQYLFDLADEAQTQEYDLHKLVTTKVLELSESMPREWRNSLDDRTTVRLPGFDQPITRYTLISIAMNLGNAQNRQRLMDGYGWNQADLEAIKGALTAEDMRFVQGIWDSVELLWPYMAELEKRMSGLPPVKVPAEALEVAGETFRGGYFPLVYDPKKSGAGEKQTNEAESVQSFVAQGYGRANTNRGATMQRLENFKAPVMLDYEQVLSGHLAKVIKDISHREAVLGINKILTQPAIKSALIDKLGESRYQEMRQWLQVLVTDRTDVITGGKWQARLLMATRTNMAIVTMGWKISTMMAQFAGFGPSADLVKPSFLTKAIVGAMQSPAETWAFVQEKSGEMRNRANTIDRDVRDAINRMRGEGGVAANVRRTAFYLTAMADRIVSVPTWLGAYNQALAEGKSEEAAIRAGDRAVRLSQGGGGAKDLAAVQRNGELMKLLTMFYTPFNVLYARLRDLGFQTATNGIGYLPHAAARFLALVIMPAVLGELLTGRGPDDDEDEIWWAARKVLLYPLATVPLVRDAAGYIEAGMISATGEGKMEYAPSFKLSPIVTVLEKLIKLPGKMVDAMQGDREIDDTTWDVFEASGYIFGLPTGQLRVTGEYLEDLLIGDADPENAMELLRDGLFRRRKKN